MKQKRHDNPDFVKYSNDRKQKELTKKHRIQKLQSDLYYYGKSVERYTRWLEESKLKVKELRSELESLGALPTP